MIEPVLQFQGLSKILLLVDNDYEIYLVLNIKWTRLKRIIKRRYADIT